MLTEQNFQDAAKRLGVPVAAIKAVTKVESKGEGFMTLPGSSTKVPVILYERHIMDRLLKAKGRVITDQPDLVNPTPGGYGKYSEQPAKLERAARIDRECALQSCSWGLFQIMGFHWQAIGYPSLQAFVNAMYKDEASHLDAFVRFLSINPSMLDALRRRDWPAFARAYNGPGYRTNAYDVKLQQAYNEAGGK